MDNIGDKGVSAGEESTLTFNNLYIKNVLIGIASKDDSTVVGEKISIKNA